MLANWYSVGGGPLMAVHFWLVVIGMQLLWLQQGHGRMEISPPRCSWTRGVPFEVKQECCKRIGGSNGLSRDARTKLEKTQMAIDCVQKLTQQAFVSSPSFPMKCCKVPTFTKACRRARYCPKKLNKMLRESLKNRGGGEGEDEFECPSQIRKICCKRPVWGPRQPEEPIPTPTFPTPTFPTRGW